jgi:hypothetical protein
VFALEIRKANQAKDKDVCAEIFLAQAKKVAENLPFLEKIVLFVVLSYAGCLDSDFYNHDKIIALQMGGLGVASSTSRGILGIMCRLADCGMLEMRSKECCIKFSISGDVKDIKGELIKICKTGPSKFIISNRSQEEYKESKCTPVVGFHAAFTPFPRAQIVPQEEVLDRRKQKSQPASKDGPYRGSKPDRGDAYHGRSSRSKPLLIPDGQGLDDLSNDTFTFMSTEKATELEVIH